MGGQDELVFDGGSFAVGADGEICVQAESFEESCAEVVVDAARQGLLVPGHVVEAKTDLARFGMRWCSGFVTTSTKMASRGRAWPIRRY